MKIFKRITGSSIAVWILLTFPMYNIAQPFNEFIRFDGINDELSGLASNIFPSNSDLTIEFWFRTCTDLYQENYAIMGNSDNIEINMAHVGPNTYYQLCASSVDNFWTCHQDHQYPPDTKWHHIAATYNDALQRFEFYFDGIDGTISSSHSFDLSPSGTMLVGYTGYQTWLYEHFNGYIDELRISDIIRYNGNFEPPNQEFETDANTRALWNFNHNQSNVILDASGNDFHLNATGNPQILSLNIQLVEPNILTIPDLYNTYQWIDCMNDSIPIENETHPSFAAGSNGVYAVEVTDGDCTLLSSCFDFNLVGLNNHANNPILLYPTPVRNKLNIISNPNIGGKVQLLGVTGKVLSMINLDGQHVSFDMQNFPPGVYFLKWISNNDFVTKSIIKV